MQMNDTQIVLIGNGNLAVNIARFLEINAIKFDWFQSNLKGRYFTTEDESTLTRFYLCAVNEPNLDSLLNQFEHKNKHSYYGHFSGSIGLNVFPNKLKLNSFVFHPMQTFPNKETKIDIEECTFTFQGEETILNQLKSVFLNKLSILSLSIKSAEAYHLMGVFASNFLPALVSICNGLGKQNGLNETEVKQLILPLMKQTLTNIESNNLFDALSGPLKRNATVVIEKHEDYLNNFKESYSDIYRLFNQILNDNILKR